MNLFPNSIWLCLVASVAAQLEHSTPNYAWGWQCVNNGYELGPRCERQKMTPDMPGTSLQTCRLTCGPSGTLFPEPKQVSLGKRVIFLLPSGITHTPHSCQDHVCMLLSEAFKIMIATLNKYHPHFAEKQETLLWEGHDDNSTIANHKLMIKFYVSGVEEHVTLETDESYTIEASTTENRTLVNITAPTFFGARHALETLSQLMDYDKSNNALQMVESISIKDAPVFPYRGVLVDTSRNFFSVKSLKRIIRGMSYNKLNYFHWHLSDSQSFPFYLKSLPKMAMYGSYSPEEVYTAEQVKDIVQYARIRGVRIIPELDAPAHVAHGWQWGEEEGLGNLVVCVDKEPWLQYCAGPPCGQMNIANPNLYQVLEGVYKELVEMFHPIEMFHYGGDEIFLSCWNSSTEITSWMESNGYGLEADSYYKQWSVFQERARNLLVKVNMDKEVPGILWTSELTHKDKLDKYLDKDKYIIQIWTTAEDPTIKNILEKGYKVIFSNYDVLYLDCGVGSFVSHGNNWCSPYKNWQGIYDNDIKSIARNLTGSDHYEQQILGAEVPLWSEQIDEHVIDAKLWPRGSAHAERMWSNPKGNYSTALNRLGHHRQRLVQRGIMADRIQPEWCRQNQGKCRLPVKVKLPWEPEEVTTEADPVQLFEIHKETEGEYTIPLPRLKSSAAKGTFDQINVLCCFVFNSVAWIRIWSW